MMSRVPPKQFDLFAAPASSPSSTPIADAAVPEHPDDAIIAALIAGKEADWYSVSLGYHPCDPHHASRPAPWSLPSRLFKFPYRFSRTKDEGTRIGVRHPLLRDHPHVIALAARTGFPVVDDPRGGCGGDGRWYHAVDLCSDAHWRTLLDLRRFTTLPAIAGAAAVALRHDGFTLANARAVLDAIGCPEPADRSMSILATVKRTEHKNDRGVVVRPINLFPPNRDELPPGWDGWLLIHGREDGVFVFRGDHLEWNPKFGSLA